MVEVAELAKEKWDEVFQKQFVKGWEKYGVELTTFNGRNPFTDAMEELVDAFQYLTQASIETKEFAKLLLFYGITLGFWDEFDASLKKKIEELAIEGATLYSVNQIAPKRGENGKVYC